MPRGTARAGDPFGTKPHGATASPQLCCCQGFVTHPNLLQLHRGDVALDLYPQLPFPRSYHQRGAASLAGHTGLGQAPLLAWLLLCTYRDLRLLNYLEKNFNHKREKPMDCFFLCHVVNSGDRKTATHNSTLKPQIPLESCGVF